jgi:exonuclease VII large subunit
LSRGYSLTKRLSDGRVLRQAIDVQAGDRVSTLLGDGEIVSVVERVDADE